MYKVTCKVKYIIFFKLQSYYSITPRNPLWIPNRAVKYHNKYNGQHQVESVNQIFPLIHLLRMLQSWIKVLKTEIMISFLSSVLRLLMKIYLMFNLLLKEE